LMAGEPEMDDDHPIEEEMDRHYCPRGVMAMI
jgi:hypothetical protein